MKRFVFPLEKAEAWRASKLQIEEAKLNNLLAGRSAVEASRDELEAEVAAAASAVARAGALEGNELVALDRFRTAAAVRLQTFASRLAECDKLIADQRARVVLARRDCRLLERLREKRLAAWQRQYDTELDQLASEAHLAKLARER